MKNNKSTLMISAKFIIGLLALTSISMIACNKDHCNSENQTDTQQPDATTEAAMQSEYALAKQANDSLSMFHDSLMICQNNPVHHDSTHYITMMHHCDNLYHTHDSLMMVHHNAMHSSSGGMMSGGGGMMGNNSSMNCTMNGMQCQTAIDSLHTIHANHHP